ncbi:hypothetical protein [Paroceanicella profunda]|uniref:hypothetical protein n=1 Tax=Paroceanicella profunda TaxID=2579971 RepID=UPI001EF15A78|nr:hypothetical protein [Paroceanicella profunda]
MSSIASRIRAIVAGETLAGSLSARDTVTCDTPASRPTASIVTPREALRLGAGGLC